MEILGYHLIEISSKRIIKAYKANQGTIARNRANRMDLNYGSINYSVKIIFG